MNRPVEVFLTISRPFFLIQFAKTDHNETMSLRNLDPNLVVRAQQGDADARFAVLEAVAGWLPKAVALRHPTIRGRDDLCQDVLLQVHLGLNRVEKPERFSAWVYGVLRYCSANRYRAQKRHLIDYVEDLDSAHGDAASTRGSHAAPMDPEQRAAWRESWVRGMKALASLDEPLRELYALHLEGWSLTEIARLLDLPRGTAASRLRKAQHLIRRRLGVLAVDSKSPTAGSRNRGKGGKA